MFSKRRSLLRVGVWTGCAAALAFLVAGCSPSADGKPKIQRDESIPVSTAPVALAPLDRTLPVVGTLFPKDEATIGAQVEGQVERTFLDFGDQVRPGDELALIDTASYDALARQADAAVVKAQANALNAEQNLKRVIELQKSKISSASDLDAATAQAEQARAEVKSAEAADVIAELNLKRSHARAVFEGSVSARLVNAGDYVKVGGALFRVVNDTELKYIVQAPERYAGEVKKDQVVEFTVDAWPDRTFTGTVYLINPSVMPSTRSFTIAARVANRARELKANTFARGELILERAVPTPVVPLDAVVSFAGITKVFVIQENTARSREVKVGRVQGQRQEVLEGLKPGEQVAVVGQTRLYDGAKIRLLPSETKTASR